MVYFVIMSFFICSTRDKAQALRHMEKQSIPTAEGQEPSHRWRFMTNDV